MTELSAKIKRGSRFRILEYLALTLAFRKFVGLIEQLSSVWNLIGNESGRSIKNAREHGQIVMASNAALEVLKEDDDEALVDTKDQTHPVARRVGGSQKENGAASLVTLSSCLKTEDACEVDNDTENVSPQSSAGSVRATKRLKNGGAPTCTTEHIYSVVRSRRQKSAISSQSHVSSLEAENESVQWSNVPGSSSASSSSTAEGEDEQLSRLKSACQYAWIDFVHKCPSLMNNNVKIKKTKGEKSKNFSCADEASLGQSESTTAIILSSREPGKTGLENGLDQVIRQPNGCSSWDAWKLYKFLKFIVILVIMFLKVFLVSFILIFTLYCLMVLHKPTQAFLSRHTQDLIYPFMRTIRFGSLPVISRFPQLHEFYEDACVLSNPFFEMNDVSCWPCESVRHVIDLTGFSNFTSGYYHSGIPFIVTDAFSHDVEIEDIYRLYREEENVSGSIILQSSRNQIQTFEDLVRHQVKSGNPFSGNLRVVWKINRVQYARLMRKSFSRPYFIPNSTEISVQHFLFVDEPSAEQYSFPTTEFANVYVMQSEGRRLIVLVPVRHCRTTCKAISVVLQPRHVLFYNWLFWSPISFPLKSLEGNDLSVTYVGSFY